MQLCFFYSNFVYLLLFDLIKTQCYKITKVKALDFFHNNLSFVSCLYIKFIISFNLNYKMYENKYYKAYCAFVLYNFGKKLV